MGMAVILGVTGCRTISLLNGAELSPGHRPDNIYKVAKALPRDLRRVAVLPLASVDNSAVLADGREALQPVLLGELQKTKRFEVVTIAPQVLRARTGRAVWSAGDSFPTNFFASLREVSACDAVLFAELTEYRAYAPVAVGWRLKLVDARTGFTLWAGDELFDARRPEVAAGAKQHRSADRFPGETGSDWAVLHSPRWFAQYTVAQMFDTLPVR